MMSILAMISKPWKRLEIATGLREDDRLRTAMTELEGAAARLDKEASDMAAAMRRFGGAEAHAVNKGAKVG